MFVGYASRFGHALIDRRLYLPKDWAADAERRKRASVPEAVSFATKPAMACEMIARALDHGLPCAWVLADSLYGSDCRFRHLLEKRGQPYVLGVRSNHTPRFLEEWQLIQTDPAAIMQGLAKDDWKTLAAGEGTKGPRLYRWARAPLSWAAEPGVERWLVIRRSLKDQGAVAHYFAYAKAGASLAKLAGAAGLRWTIEECFLRAKNDVGLDHCEARSWHGWHRHMTLVMAAAAFLAKLTANQRRAAFRKRDKTSPFPQMLEQTSSA